MGRIKEVFCPEVREDCIWIEKFFGSFFQKRIKEKDSLSILLKFLYDALISLDCANKIFLSID